ncbi:uncharacterized protein LOC143448679 [Clavelina lepadiformis]|uniref:Uncharacterized protein n=1 Tax=Clavelina lepadiformis TaxID=159417 RepID=A0ABP0GKT0_CLALP
MMRKRHTEKSALLPVRPSPPTLKEIEEDVKSADKNDYVFTSMTSVNDDFNFAEDLNSTDDSIDADEIQKRQIVLEQYEKVCKFLELNDSLKVGQTNLNKACKKLIETGGDVKSAMTDLSIKLEQQRQLLKKVNET